MGSIISNSSTPASERNAALLQARSPALGLTGSSWMKFSPHSIQETVSSSIGARIPTTNPAVFYSASKVTASASVTDPSHPTPLDLAIAFGKPKIHSWKSS
jgi:PhoPQ-activated pathogenicity-related protein